MSYIWTLIVGVAGVCLWSQLSTPPEDNVPEMALQDLSPDVQNWFSKGKFVNVYNRNMFTIVQGEEGEGKETILLIHGFPTSSFDYHRTIGLLTQKYRVVAFDHLGFGFSDKPRVNYTYSIGDQADQVLQLWRQLGVKSGHIVAHDMGDSVLTEILTRYEKKMLPEYFNNFFKSVTFTNGGMRYHLINFRLSQHLLLSPLAPYISKIFQETTLGDYFVGKQLSSIWSPSYSDGAQMSVDIENINKLNKYKNGNHLTYKTITYLRDRAYLEERWLASLARLTHLPIQILWGDSDSVAPMSIPVSLTSLLARGRVEQVTIQGAGHFTMLETPREWASAVLQFVGKHTEKRKQKQK